MSSVEGGNLPNRAPEPREYISRGSERVDLNSGYLPFPVPAEVRVAAAHATLDPDLAPQTGPKGLLLLREAASRKFNREHGIYYSPENVLVTNGSSGALRLVFSRYNGLYEPDKPAPKVWTPEIGYNYTQIARASGIGDVARYPLKDGVPDVDQIAEKFKESKDRRNIFIINSPGNPNGKVIPDPVFDDLSQIFREQDVAVEDNVFGGMTYDGIEHASIAKHLPHQTVIIDSSSKRGANFQVGWLMAPSDGDLYEDLMEIRDITGGVFPPAQFGVSVLLDAEGDELQHTVDKMHSEMQRKRNLMHELVVDIPGFEETEKPEGGFFYLLPGLDAVTVREECNVVINGGERYNAPGFGRVSFAAKDKAIIEGMERIKQYRTR